MQLQLDFKEARKLIKALKSPLTAQHFHDGGAPVPVINVTHYPSIYDPRLSYDQGKKRWFLFFVKSQFSIEAVAKALGCSVEAVRLRESY